MSLCRQVNKFDLKRIKLNFKGGLPAMQASKQERCFTQLKRMVHEQHLYSLTRSKDFDVSSMCIHLAGVQGLLCNLCCCCNHHAANRASWYVLNQVCRRAMPAVLAGTLHPKQIAVLQHIEHLQCS